jgi:hypothetical protein
MRYGACRIGNRHFGESTPGFLISERVQQSNGARELALNSWSTRGGEMNRTQAGQPVLVMLMIGLAPE